jgi:superoxide reductase
MDKKWPGQEDLLCGVNDPQVRDDLDHLAVQHTPLIDAPDRIKKDEYFEVNVMIGRLQDHPNEPDHFIEWIELYAGDTFLGRSQFNGGSSYPESSFMVKMTHAQGPLKVWAKCNRHGLWRSTKEIWID